MKPNTNSNIIYLFSEEKGEAMPSQERRKQIEQIVDKILLDNNLLVPAFDLTKFLVEKKGFQIVLQNVDEDTTGLLFIDDENYIPNTQTHKLIAVNSNLQTKSNFIQKRRFITAHEYAHSELHKKNHTQYAHRDHSKSDKAEEKEADFFARCLLMPRKLVEQILELDFVKNIDIEKKVNLISNIFNVTPKKAKQRLVSDLGYNE